MGKQSRRPNRRNRHSRIKVRQENGGLKVSIFTSPSVVGGEVSLKNELRLVRSALLYADTVELVSPGATMLSTLNPLSGAGDVDPSSLLSQLDDETLTRLGLERSPNEVRQVFEMLPKLMSLPEEDRRAVLPRDAEQELLTGLAELQSAMATAGDFVGGVLKRSGSPELEIALEKGVLTVDSAGFRSEMQTEDQIEWYAARLRSALGNPVDTLLLDERTVKFLQDMDVDAPAETVRDRATRAAAGSGLLERLPTFPDAAMNDVLEVRDALAEGRSRYRVAVKRLAAELSSTALDETLPAEIDEVWRDEVRPTLLDMQKTVRASSLARGTARRLASDYKSLLTGGTLIVAIENLAQLSPTTTGSIAVGTNIAWQATAEVLHARAEVRKRDLVYLLDVHRRLGGAAL